MLDIHHKMMYNTMKYYKNKEDEYGEKIGTGFVG